MNPLEQPKTPVEPTVSQPSAEDDAATLQAIESLEAEDTSTSVQPTPVQPLSPMDTPLTSVPVVDAQPVSTNPTPGTTPADSPVVGAATAFSSQASVQSPISNYAPSPIVSEKKKTNKLVITLLVVVLVAVGVAAGYFAWQSM